MTHVNDQTASPRGLAAFRSGVENAAARNSRKACGNCLISNKYLYRLTMRLRHPAPFLLEKAIGFRVLEQEQQADV
tara:strand:+ start:425 stop:652 length:228 start_codon:yes stop_codon:yes gene_type:complete